MTQENKNLLIKDLCARLPYGVKVMTSVGGEIRNDKEQLNFAQLSLFENSYEDIKPYLFPLSSMTEEQWKEYQTLKITDWVEGDINGVFINAGTITDWLNKNHFDYRGLIEKGLAIEAPEGMYN